MLHPSKPETNEVQTTEAVDLPRLVSLRGGCFQIHAGVIEGQFTRTGGWFRLFGRGFAVKDTTFHPLLFSERNGYVRRIQIGKWSIKFLSA